jgi:hypothetical protein
MFVYALCVCIASSPHHVDMVYNSNCSILVSVGFCSTRDFPKYPSIPALLGSGVPPPVYRYHNDVGGDAHFM